jgi:hypothetical protein
MKNEAWKGQENIEWRQEDIEMTYEHDIWLDSIQMNHSGIKSLWFTRNVHKFKICVDPVLINFKIISPRYFDGVITIPNCHFPNYHSLQVDVFRVRVGVRDAGVRVRVGVWGWDWQFGRVTCNHFDPTVQKDNSGTILSTMAKGDPICNWHKWMQRMQRTWQFWLDDHHYRIVGSIIPRLTMWELSVRFADSRNRFRNQSIHRHTLLRSR